MARALYLSLTYELLAATGLGNGQAGEAEQVGCRKAWGMRATSFWTEHNKEQRVTFGSLGQQSKRDWLPVGGVTKHVLQQITREKEHCAVVGNILFLFLICFLIHDLPA